MTNVQPSTERRSVDLAQREYNPETRELSLCFASETSVARWYGMEILSCDPAHVDLSRLKSNGRLLLDHSNEVDDIAGTVLDATVDADRRCPDLSKVRPRCSS